MVFGMTMCEQTIHSQEARRLKCEFRYPLISTQEATSWTNGNTQEEMIMAANAPYSTKQVMQDPAIQLEVKTRWFTKNMIRVAKAPTSTLLQFVETPRYQHAGRRRIFLETTGCQKMLLLARASKRWPWRCVTLWIGVCLHVMQCAAILLWPKARYCIGSNPLQMK